MLSSVQLAMKMIRTNTAVHVLTSMLTNSKKIQSGKAIREILTLLFAVSEYTHTTMSSVIIVIIYSFGKTSIFFKLKIIVPLADNLMNEK